MNSARVLIRQGDIGKYKSFWATVREMGDKIEERLGIYSFCCYDTRLFKTASQAREEARRFCRWKKLRIRKFVELT